MSALAVVLEPALVEEAVLHAIAGRSAEERAFRSERDALYEVEEERRETAFRDLHLAWFGWLALGRPIHQAIAELPILADSCARCVVGRAVGRRDEGADLRVSEEDAGGLVRTILVRLGATRLAEPERLLGFLREELLHVADMVDPAFGYEPDLPSSECDPAYQRIVRDRYRALWSTTIAGRLCRRGVAGEPARAAAARAFATSFGLLGSDVDEAFQRFFAADEPRHASLVAFALSPRLDEAGPLPDRCPLCRFPTRALVAEPDALPREVKQEIVSDFPEWSPAAGLCAQCAELYRARPLSRQSAAALPHAAGPGIA